MYSIEDEMLALKGLMRNESIVEFRKNYIIINNLVDDFYADFYIEKGNHKLPSNWYIANTGSGSECCADELELCDYGLKNGDGSCYCLKAERLYPNCLDCRLNNEHNWRKIVDNDYVAEFTYGLLLASKQATKNKMSVLRFNESYDVESNESLWAMEKVAFHLDRIGVPTMIYTHRWDMLKQFEYVQHLVVNGSDFMLDNEFRVVDEFSGENLKCCGDCGLCEKIGRAYCTKKLGKVIEVIKH